MFERLCFVGVRDWGMGVGLGGFFRKLALLLALTLTLTLSYSQGRLVLQGNAWIVIDNAAAVVLENPATNAITLGPGGGNIRSEAENDRLVWRIGTGIGNYIIPWTTGTGVQIPLVMTLTTPGAGAGSFVLSTHTDFDAVNNWDNFDYRPSDVTNMGGLSIANNSASAIDRFWRIEGSGYTTLPQATLNFAYNDAERTAPGNTIPAGTLRAQRFSVPADGWLPGIGTDNHPTTSVTAAVVLSDFHRSWTLATLNTPLPATEFAFTAQRDGRDVRLDWTAEDGTAAQAYHTERQRPDGTFEHMATYAAGQPLYRDWDRTPLPGLNHYRIAIEDQDGQRRHSELRSVYFGLQNVVVAPQPLSDASTVQLLGFAGQRVQYRWVDMAGRVLAQGEYLPDADMALLPIPAVLAWARGVYVLHVRASDGFATALRIVAQD